MNTKNIAELTAKTNEMIAAVRNGAASKYYSFVVNEDTDNEETITIRVSDHNANPSRVSGKTIIFIIADANTDVDREDTDCTSMHISKKSFVSIAGQYILDKNNCDENGYDVDYLLDYDLN